MSSKSIQCGHRQLTLNLQDRYRNLLNPLVLTLCSYKPTKCTDRRFAASSILTGTGSVGTSLLFWILGYVLSLSSLSVYLEYAAYFPSRSGSEVVRMPFTTSFHVSMYTNQNRHILSRRTHDPNGSFQQPSPSSPSSFPSAAAMLSSWQDISSPLGTTQTSPRGSKRVLPSDAIPSQFCSSFSIQNSHTEFPT